MTLFEELTFMVPSIVSKARRVDYLGDPIHKLPFDGSLSPDELRMANEDTFAWVHWERE